MACSVIVIYNSIRFIKGTIIFIRIEPSSSVPIYRQIIDQIKYQIAAGILKEGDRVPSVRELASRLAVNQNTILKVYNELCRENVLKIERGDGTFVSSGKQTLSQQERREMVAGPLREAAVLAIQLGVPIEQAAGLLQTEYEKILSQRNNSAENGKEQGDVQTLSLERMAGEFVEACLWRRRQCGVCDAAVSDSAVSRCGQLCGHLVCADAGGAGDLCVGYLLRRDEQSHNSPAV